MDGKSPFLNWVSKQSGLAMRGKIRLLQGPWAVYRRQNRLFYQRQGQVNMPRDAAGCMEVVGSRLAALTWLKTVLGKTFPLPVSLHPVLIGVSEMLPPLRAG